MSAITVNRPTSLGLSALLHASFLALGFIGALFMRGGEEVVITPVTLIGPDTLVDPGFAEASLVPEEAMTEDPIEILPPEPVAEVPAPDPKPAPKAAPTPKVAPTPKSPPAVAAKGKTPATKSAAPAFDMSKLEQDLATPRPTGAQRSGGRQGPSQSQRELEARLSEGQARAATANAINAIGSKIADNWNISCATAEDRAITIKLRLELTRDGKISRVALADFPRVEAISDPRLRAAAIAALSAAQAAAPFEGLPEQTYSQWRSLTPVFPASEECARRMGR